MKPHSASFLLFLAAALLLSSCEVGRQTSFNEADFKWARGKGSGVVAGHAYIEMRDKSVNVADGAPVELVPVTAYSAEFITRQAQNGAHLTPADLRESQYVHSGVTDGNGNFTIGNLAPGEYYVTSGVHWINRYWSPDSDNNLQKVATHHIQYIWARVTVRNGQTARVTAWNQGADRNLDDIIH